MKKQPFILEKRVFFARRPKRAVLTVVILPSFDVKKQFFITISDQYPNSPAVNI